MKHKLKEVLPTLGISQKELANRIDMTEVGMSKLINGTTTKATLEKIAKELSLDISDIMVEEKVYSAKYEGILSLGNVKMDVAVLENGQRIIKQAAVFKALDRPARGNSRVIGIPTFMDAKNLQSYVNEDIKVVIKKVEYLDIKGTSQQGFDCLILPTVCDLYLKAREDGVLLPSQSDTARKAEILIRSLAKVGIIAMVDEATGYDKEKSRAKNELQKFFATFLVDEAAKWVKTFDDLFFEDLYKMRKWNWDKTAKRPGVVGTWIKEIVYDRLAPVLPELEKRNPKNENGNRSYKHHQFLSKEVGLPRLKQHLEAVHAIAVISNYDWGCFIVNLDKAYPRKYQELYLFDE